MEMAQLPVKPGKKHILYFFPKHGMIVCKGENGNTVQMTFDPAPVKEEGNSEDFFWEMIINPQTNEMWYSDSDHCLRPITFVRPVAIPFISARRIHQYKYRMCLDEGTSLIHYYEDTNPEKVLGIVAGFKKVNLAVVKS